MDKTQHTPGPATYQRLEFDAEGAPVVCVYLEGAPHTPVTCRPASRCSCVVCNLQGRGGLNCPHAAKATGSAS